MFVNRNLILWRAPRPADPVGRVDSGCMSTLPSLLSLTIDAAVLNIHHLTNLNAIPDAIVLELFQACAFFAVFNVLVGAWVTL
eukprot:c21580_g1_i1 orf=490-738(-)